MTTADEQVLTRLVRAHGTPRKLAERAQMVLLAAGGTGVREIAAGSASGRRPCAIGWAAGAPPTKRAGGSAIGGCAASGRTGDVHARADLRDRRIGLRATVGRK
jgi:putative transposase